MGPSEICSRRLAARQTERQRLERLHRLLGNARLAGVAVGLVGVWWVETSAPAYTWIAVLALAAAFLRTSQVFSRTEASMLDAALAATFYSTPVTGQPRRTSKEAKAAALGTLEDHPFALDVDVLRPNGLFDLLNTCATREGMRRLAGFLTEPAMTEAIWERQAAVRELKPQLDLRERLFVEGSRRTSHIRTDQMQDWGAQAAPPVPRWIPMTFLALSASVVCALVALALSPSAVTYGFAGALLLLEMAAWQATRKRVQVPSLGAPKLHIDFEELQALLRIVEGLEFESPRLQEISGALGTGSSRASRALRRLCQLTSLYEARQNQIVALFGPIVAFETQLSLALERWRIRHGFHLALWIEAVARLEAYASLATFAYENPLYVFPELDDRAPGLCATGLAHPLLGDKAVANDIALDGERTILVVSGANMAGKSTLLRTIGTNLSLAYSGAPVRATSMTTSSLALIASIRVTDSLQLGESRFSAELRRIKAMLESVRAGRQTLVLIDELFGGTNSYDRFAGAVALAEFLLGFDTALAVLSTHDRNVTRWVGENPGRVSNVHFRDTLEDGRMSFDYRLRPGPATKGNAVELMKLAGVPIPADQAASHG